jgi:hypothetical protein
MIKFAIRILAAITMLLSTVGLLIALAGGIGVWLVKEPVTEKATALFERIETKLDKADKGLEHAEKTLARASDRLADVREERRKAAANPGRLDVARRFLARTVRQTIAPDLGDAHETLHTVSEAAVVVNSILDDMGSFPFLGVTGLDVDRLSEMNSRLAGVGPMAWELSRLLGDSAPDSDPGAQLSRIEQTLKTMQGLITDYQSQVTQVRERTDALKSLLFRWIMPVTIGISVVCFWIALSQISLLCHAWSWWKCAGRGNA